MRLSWNEIRARAAHFAEEWKDAHYERGETQTFYNEFFEVFGVTRRRVASFEEPVKKLGTSRGFIDLFWKGVLLVEQKSAGRNLTKAKEQAFNYFEGIKEHELPRYVLVSDFQSFELHDLEGEEQPVEFALRDLHKNVNRFAFILGVQKRAFRDQDPVNIKASMLMGKLHDALKASGYVGHDLEKFLVRLIFCLFADATGIFEPRGVFLDLITQRTREDGSDVGQWLSHLFEVLNLPAEKRQKALNSDLAQFEYINGDLFRERLGTPAFDATMRKKLIEVCEFSWDAISPAIFGSLFQSVMNAKERREQGAHYTSEKNILKVIEPLFVDRLKAEFQQVRGRRDKDRALKAFHDKLAGLTFFDPACGCGNFLIIAYRELRLLEIDLLRELNPRGQRVLDVSKLSKLDVNQFYGIEISEFPARIAEVALWMMDHIMNNRLSLEFGDNFARIPLRTSPHIHHADALEIEWSSVLKSSDCSYIFGNPPFSGQSYQTPAQRAQMRRVIDAVGGRAGSLDYVCAWFIKAGAYIGESSAPIAFVATNSITQGEQVAQLWPLLFDRYGLEIAFAHRTFAWLSDAKGGAHVHCVIVGLTHRKSEPAEKRLFSYDDIAGDPVESRHSSLSPYLFDASKLATRHLVVRESRKPIIPVTPLRMGSKIVDDGHYILNEDERAAFIKSEPEAAKYLCPLVGSEEFINGTKRWILRLDNVPPKTIRSMPLVAQRVAAVKAYRLASKKAKTRELADYPTRFEVTTIPQRDFLAIPKVSSERRDYVPIGWLKPPTLPSQLVQVMIDADLVDFGLVTSRMHMSWMRYIGGRMKSDYQYSIGLVYNAFPWPKVDARSRVQIITLAQNVLDARADHAGSSLADLYDPNVMPPNLRRAHRALDAAVDRLYRGSPFDNDRERVEHLFGLYEKMVAPLVALAKSRPARAKRHSA